MPWPDEKAARAALAQLPETVTIEQAKAALSAAGIPELVGMQEAAEILGVDRTNLRSVRGMPAPAYTLACGRLWLGTEVRQLAKDRRARQRAASK